VTDNPLITPPASTSPLISAAGLATVAGADPGPGTGVVLLDVRWTLAGSDPEGYRQAHLPGAVFVDLDRDLAGRPGLGGRHPLPEPGQLQDAWRASGLDNDSTVVVYDGGSGLAAARAWWLLRWSGVRAVRVLDGGLPAWTSAGRPTESGPQPPAVPGSLTVSPGSMPVVDVDEAAQLAVGTSSVLIDARAGARYRGEIEPLDPVAGHIPGSVNLPIGDLLAPDGTFRPPEELAAAFAALGVAAGGSADPVPAAASCGSGITACQLVLAGEIAGVELALYPGSYSQWCAMGRPIAVGG
jgi:thiosulfate/3-mercaptopyruvate sulfurtransferase